MAGINKWGSKELVDPGRLAKPPTATGEPSHLGITDEKQDCDQSLMSHALPTCMSSSEETSREGGELSAGGIPYDLEGGGGEV